MVRTSTPCIYTMTGPDGLEVMVGVFNHPLGAKRAVRRRLGDDWDGEVTCRRPPMKRESVYFGAVWDEPEPVFADEIFTDEKIQTEDGWLGGDDELEPIDW